MRKKSNFVKGKISGLIKLFYTKFDETVFIELFDGKRILVHTDGTIYFPKQIKLKKVNRRI